jgi:hypothetical protein
MSNREGNNHHEEFYPVLDCVMTGVYNGQSIGQRRVVSVVGESPGLVNLCTNGKIMNLSVYEVQEIISQVIDEVMEMDKKLKEMKKRDGRITLQGEK